MASEIKVNKISPATGTALQISDSGDTTTIPSGATVTAAGTINVTGTINNTGTATGFGAIDWQTGDIKTSTFTGVAGKGYFVNTAGGAVTANLPSSPSAGDQMAVSDYGNNAGTNAITIGRNGSNIEGAANDYNIFEDGAAVTLVYVDGTKGWIVVSTADAQASASDYIIASGGTESTSGNEKIHVFTGDGTFTVTSAGSSAGSNTVTYLVIAGGGGGGNYSGGGGGGGYRTNYGPGTPTLPGTGGLAITAGSFPIQVGGGGARAGNSGYARGTNGENSIFSSITSAGGGGGGTYAPGPSNGDNVGLDGGNGGGGGILEQPRQAANAPGTAGAGNTPPVSPSQGNPGGLGSHRTGTPTNHYGGGGGGGGIGGAGSNAGYNDPGAGGSGGRGTPSQISGVNMDRGGGGGGAISGSGGSGGGGAGAAGSTSTAGNGTDNKGGGGGGGRSGSYTNAAGAGGSGLVVIRYKYQN